MAGLCLFTRLSVTRHEYYPPPRRIQYGQRLFYRSLIAYDFTQCIYQKSSVSIGFA
jgi:hypothetical protein